MSDSEKVYYACPGCDSQVWVYRKYSEFIGRPCLECEPPSLEDIQRLLACTNQSS